nr:FGGY family carbohydrate kinase [Patulibacter sp. SYSU D01012]
MLIGVDLGTTATKAAVFTADGTQLGAATAPTELRWHGPGEVDQDPDAFYAAATDTIRRAMEAAGADPARVAGLAVTGQMAGMLGVDRDWRPALPYDSWLDTRCRDERDALDRELGDELTRLTGCPPMVNHGPKLRWWARNRPEELARMRAFVMPGAYVAGRLCGLAGDDAFIDPSYLHFTGLVDARAGEWSPRLVDAVGIRPDQLPRIVPSTTVVGTLTAAAAGHCGLRPGTPVAAGLGDTAAGALGAGLVRPGRLLDTAGTAAILAGATAEYRPDVDGRTLILMRGAVEGLWIPLAYLSGGSLVDWFCDLLHDGDERIPRPGFADLVAGLEDLPAGADGLVFVPHLDGRILPSSPDMGGAWVGLRRGHGRRHLAKAMLEGVAYEYALYLERLRTLNPTLELTEARVIGGGARSAVWNQIKASVLGVPYATATVGDVSCWGAALIAGTAVGLVDDLADAAERAAPVADRTSPRPKDTSVYRDLFDVYRDVVARLDEPFDRLAAHRAAVATEARA